MPFSDLDEPDSSFVPRIAHHLDHLSKLLCLLFGIDSMFLLFFHFKEYLTSIDRSVVILAFIVKEVQIVVLSCFNRHRSIVLDLELSFLHLFPFGWVSELWECFLAIDLHDPLLYVRISLTAQKAFYLQAKTCSLLVCSTNVHSVKVISLYLNTLIHYMHGYHWEPVKSERAVGISIGHGHVLIVSTQNEDLLSNVLFIFTVV